MAVESSKKYRTAAAGLLGQFLDFILNSAELNDNQKKEKIFASFEDAIVHYNGQERYQLFLAFQYYIKNLL